MKNNNNFILAGNGSYLNRGCEAIVRGTTVVFRQNFHEPSFDLVSIFPNEASFDRQRAEERDPAISHFSFARQVKRFESLWWKRNLLKIFAPEKASQEYYRPMLQLFNGAAAVLSVGGDNYSLEYGLPGIFTGLDDVTLAEKKPLIIWGASIGPFNKRPEYEKYMAAHLRKVTAIFARETATLGYLDSIGVKDNIYYAADPAFLMEPQKPVDGFSPLAGAVGINLSPLMARFVSGGNLAAWVKLAAEMVQTTAGLINRKIYLIPHVTVPHDDDHSFLSAVKKLLPSPEIELLDAGYNAAELKYIVSKLAAVAGSRTHFTIAAFSTATPVLSLAYSMKARGLNKDIFGHSDFCLEPDKLSPGLFADKIKILLEQGPVIRMVLAEKAPALSCSAASAGSRLRELLK
ncbi:MAG: polysaccharide pyruvyl transferase family protein [Elusimicrobiales bacterium]|jgi:polysaccharide pyruvyl transferase WcaK-like protein